MIMFEDHRSNKIEYLYHQTDINLEFQRHSHTSFEIAFIEDGILECEVDEKTFHVKKGQAILILPGQIHSYKTKEYSKSYLCIFSTDWVPRFYEKVRGCAFDNPILVGMDGSVMSTLQSADSNRFEIIGLLYGLCAKVYKNSTLQKTNEAYFALANSISFYVQNNYNKNISLRDLAEDVGYNYSYLSSFFSKHFEQGFPAYVNSFRVQRAKSYLTESEMSITQISQACGFETIRNFNRVFSRECDISPKEYRNKYKKEKTDVKKCT